MLKKTVLISLALVLLHGLSAIACTNFMLIAKDGSVIVARTMEFGPEMNSHIVTSPMGREMQSPSPDGKDGLKWTSKYGYVMIDFFGTKHAVDGINDQGLSFGWLLLPGYTEYQTVPKGENEKALFYLYAGDWVLGNYSTTDEVKEAIKDIYVYSEPVTFGGGNLKDVTFPLHMIVSDASGKSIVVEFVNGKAKVYDNPLGVLTNSPEFPWQLNNLKNYTNMTPYSPKPITLNGIEYTSTGQGSGAVGIPGDFTPPSRFVKMAFLTNSVFPAETGEETVSLANQIIGNVFVPLGAVQGEEGEKNELPDKTQWTVFKDVTNNKLYFKSYENSLVQVIDLNKIDFSKGAPVLDIPLASKQVYVDATEKFIMSTGTN